ncbi:MAG: hypothetical protein J6I71_09455 [Campylobacter sp.]|uniref:formyltransferase family protein n=1 Tax=Campylobacter sp. TaxID=205 RepID=UPI001B3FE0BA|nr:formyltransferase family protein [Campylobacter sp.]MBP3676689.1 hypothetical protein [Campylobacter sp.]
MKFCIAGKNNIAVNALDYLINELHFSKENIFVVINKTDSGVNLWQKSLKKYALDNNIKIKTLEDCYDIKDLIFLSLEFDRIIKTEVFKTKKMYNIHFSLLPAYKGMYTSALPIINGEKYSGVTLHKIDNGIDTGDIIDQIKFEIDLNDTARDLYLKYIENSFILFKKNIKNILEGNFISTSQQAIGSSYYSKKAIDYSNLKFDYKKTSFEIYNQLRAFIFPEYQLPTIDNEEIFKVELTNTKGDFCNIIKKESFYEITGIDGYIIKAFIKRQKQHNYN